MNASVILKEVWHVICEIFSHAVGIFGTIFVVAVLAALVVFFYEKAVGSKAVRRGKNRMKQGRRVAVITGASSGLGRMYAKMVDRRAKAYGVNELILVARREDRLRALADELKNPVKIFPMDLTNEGEREAFRAALEKEKAEVQSFSVTLLLNCAGFGKAGTSEELGYETENEMVELNDEAAIAMTGLLLPYMGAGSRIAQVCSVAAFQPIPKFSAYAASKALLYSYSRALRVELLKKGISVTAVCPYWIKDTEFIPIASEKGAGGAKKAGAKKNHSLFMSSKVSSVARISLYDIRHRHALSTPGIITTVDRIFAGLIPDGVLAYIMELFTIK